VSEHMHACVCYFMPSAIYGLHNTGCRERVLSLLEPDDKMSVI